MAAGEEAGRAVEAARRGSLLLGLARLSLARALGLPPESPLPPPDAAESLWLAAPGATFVTLRLDGALRGCIGSTMARRPLAEDVERNAVAAAFDDPRFPPVRSAEFLHLRLEVSLLSPLEEIQPEPALPLEACLRPGVDGIVLRYGSSQATYLPQVWRTLPEPAEFLASLRAKAGLAADFTHPDLRLWRYTVDQWIEEGFEEEMSRRVTTRPAPEKKIPSP